MYNDRTHTLTLSARPVRRQPVVPAVVVDKRKGNVGKNIFSVAEVRVEPANISPLRKVLALLLASAMICNPILVVYAEGEMIVDVEPVVEEVAPAEEVVEESVVEEASVAGPEEVEPTDADVDAPVPTDGTETEVVSDPGNVQDDIEKPAESAEEEEGVSEDDTDVTGEEIITEDETVTDGGGIGGAEEADDTDDTNSADEEDVVEEGANEDGGVISNDEEDGSETSIITEEENPADPDTSSNAEEAVAERIVREEVNDQNRYLFSKQQCVQVDGGFFCTDKETSTDDAAKMEGEAFVAQDADGDKEIYVGQNGSPRQITANAVDDDAPYYDAASGIVVWQSLINDRYQIMLFNTVTGEERKMTDTSYNNTNPHLFGTTLVWQSWIDTNWEIVMTDISQHDMPVTRVTTNTWDDMFPQVRDQFITWQGFYDGVWQVFVYDISNGTTVHLGEGEGDYENPRFMLIIDNKSEDGSVTTIGYDTRTGEVVPFGAAQKNSGNQTVPESPSQDQNTAVPVESGQTQTKTQRDTDTEGGDGNSNGNGNGNGNDDPAMSAGADLSVATNTSNDSPSAVEDPALTSSDAPSVQEGTVVLQPLQTAVDPVIEPLVLPPVASSSDSGLQ